MLDCLGLSGLNFVSPGCVQKKRLLLWLRTPKKIIFLCADVGTIVPCSLRSPALVQYLSAELQVPVHRAPDQCLLPLCPRSHLHLLQLINSVVFASSEDRRHVMCINTVACTPVRSYSCGF